MPFDFPNSPTTNQVITGVGGIMFVWDGVKWVASTTGAVVSAGVTSFNTRTGAVTLTTADVTTIADPIYLKPAAADTAYVNVTGDTMTGPLTVTDKVTVSGLNARMDLYSPGAPADQKFTDLYTDGTGTFSAQFANDAFSGGTGFMTVSRSGTAPQVMTLTAPRINLAGEVYPSASVTATGSVFAGGAIYPSNIASSNGYALYMAGNERHIRFTTDNWRLSFDAANGTLSYYSYAGTLLGQFGATGGVYGADTFNTAQLICRSTLGILYQGLNASNWIGFAWDGANVPLYVNGTYQITLVSSSWVTSWVNANMVSGTGPSPGARHTAYSFGIDLMGGTTWYHGCHDGATWFYSQVQLTAPCDERLKYDIKPTQVDALSVMRSVPIDEWTVRSDVIGWLEAGNARGEERERILQEAKPRYVPISINAQSLQKIVPDCVVIMDQSKPIEDKPEGSPLPDDLLQVNRDGLVPYLLRSIQQLADQVDALKART